MTAPTGHFVDITKRSQEAFSRVVRTWADIVGTYASSFTGRQSRVPDAHAFIDATFDLVGRVLDNQRQLTHTLFRTSAQAVEVVTDQAARTADSVSAHTVNAAEAVAHQTAAAADEAGNQAVSSARAARTSATTANSAVNNTN